MRRLKLTQGKYALLSDEDYEKMSKYKWCAHQYSPGKWRVMRRPAYNDCRYLHREIVGAEKGQIVDHINRDGLDNRRENLRIVTKQQNSANSKTTSRSGYKGVEVRDGVFRAYISVDGNRFWLGKYPSKKEAAAAYNHIALEWFGKYAYLNDIKD